MPNTGEVKGEGFTLYYYDPRPDPVHPMANLQAGDRVYAVQPAGPVDPDAPVSFTPGDKVTVIPMVVGIPPQPVPPTRWARFRAWVTRRPAPVTGEFTIGWKIPDTDTPSKG